MLLLIIAGIVVAVLAAFLIVKFLPLKLRPLVSVILIVLAIFLAWKIYDGIMKPINFNKDKKEIYAKVIKRLKMIRDAEIAYKEVTGKYTKSADSLIQFVDTAQLAITQTTNVLVKVNKGTKWQPIWDEVEKRVTDTIGYKPVVNEFKGRDYKNMFNVPGTDKQFTIAIGSVEKFQGLVVPTFEAKVAKEDILKGMDPSLVKIEKNQTATDEIRGEYVLVGSLTDVTTGGNWPPFYDKFDSAKKDDK